MSRRLKRNEGLTEGLQRVSKELHRDLLQAIGQERLTPRKCTMSPQDHKESVCEQNWRLTRGAALKVMGEFIAYCLAVVIYMFSI